MAFIRCPVCGNEISTVVNYCPFCGHQIQKEQNVVSEVVDDNRRMGGGPQLAERYRQEIAILRKRRRAMLISGIIITSVFLILTVVFSILLDLHFINIAYGREESIGSMYLYIILIIVSAFLVDAGVVLIIVGSVVNSVKIKKRENRIYKFEQR